MLNTQLLQWSLWGLSLFAGVGAILALFKLNFLQRYIPTKEEADRLQAIVPVLQEEQRQLRETIGARQQEIAQLDATVGHLRILKKWQEENPEAPARIQQMIADVARGESTRAAVQLELAQAEARLNEVKQETSRFNLEKAQLTQESGTLRDQLAALHEQKAELEKDLRDLDDQRRQLDTKVAVLRNEIQSTESRLSTLRPQVEKAEQEKTKAERERREAESARDIARAEISNLQKLKESLEQLLKRTETTLEKTGITSSKGYSDLFAPVFRVGLQAAQASQKERVALDRTRDYIKGRGLIFPERVLHAFHTSLKVSDISPLVVLAGISGTGKSELPRHYADGMGIHFLLSAVQPRWDSPQDLLGFYNYLEKKYRATELARALVQFEMHNRETLERLAKEQGSKLETRRDRMLLVLLDEMNLARTEYYFSEFLSKLETRRMVDENDPQQRARAEIEIDMGNLLNGQTALRLYPGRNVLFTGTMNEDESTQALSDKVVDRASVVRFWVPKRTHAEETPNRRPATANGLTVENWQAWLKDGNDLKSVRAELDDWLIKLNEALTAIGRPFAFRVDQAIRSYVALYPSWVQDWHKKAMADQIEQRIFPKLRGVETEQATAQLQSIGQVIAQLDDPLLAGQGNLSLSRRGSQR